MPTNSIRSTSTVRTIDDVLSQLDASLPNNASLKDSRAFVRQTTGNNAMLAAETIHELENLHVLLAPITANTSALIRLMEKYDAALCGVQATSFFYPICEITDCPWDIFCNEEYAERFITGFRTSSGADFVEDVTSDETHYRVTHFRKTLNGSKSSCPIRIISGRQSALEMVLQLQASYEQAIITHSLAIFFWPKLQQRNLYRTFENNDGLSKCPIGKTYYQMRVRPGKKTSLRNPVIAPSIYSGLDDRIETVMFNNSEGLDEQKYKASMSLMKSIVYAVHNSSTRLLGTTYNMK